ncbi:hypothetical protein PIB30_059235 [Stylosanthes scabra]|uniref:Uncharacterized protein n=1 Tax=Stylosanthes scabra TaxID=79078 RepID=A0ABU6TLH0_9FABA|nr:hypothetical protein [Stylosanthes scabra]
MGRPRKRTSVPLDLGEAEADTSTLPATSTPVIPTPSLLEGLPAMRMIPTPESRIQSFETPGTRSQRQTPTHTTTEDVEPPPSEPDPMPWLLVDNPLPKGEEEDIAMEEKLAKQAGLVYLRWDGKNCWNKVRKGMTNIFWVFQNYYRWFFWRQDDFKKLKQTNKRNRGSKTGGSLHTGGSTTYKATRERMEVQIQPPDRRGRGVDMDCGWPQGGIYGMGVVPLHKYPPLFEDPDDDNTTSSPPDLREQETLLNREISQQAEAHAQRVAAVEAVCAENVRSLKSTVQT